MRQNTTPKKEPTEKVVREIAWEVIPDLAEALIKQESRFNVAAQSPVGAYGLTQLMPGTASDLGVDRYDVKDNLRGGARYITTQLNTKSANQIGNLDAVSVT